MRIIAGRLGGRQFESPRGHRTHPMSDKIRGALFNILGDVKDLSVLDPFAGSGALSFEAVSRGAASAVAIEADRNAQKTIADNIVVLNLGEQVKLIRASANAWLQTTSGVKFDLVLCDPPYDDLQLGLVCRLSRHVASNGLLVLSAPGGIDPPNLDGFTNIERRIYGDAQLIFYRPAASLRP